MPCGKGMIVCVICPCQLFSNRNKGEVLAAEAPLVWLVDLRIPAFVLEMGPCCFNTDTTFVLIFEAVLNHDFGASNTRVN